MNPFFLVHALEFKVLKFLCPPKFVYAPPVTLSWAEMETGRVDRHRLGRPAGRVAGRVKILRPAGQAG